MSASRPAGSPLDDADLPVAATAVARLRAVVEDAESVLARLELAPEGVCLRCGAPLLRRPIGESGAGGRLCPDHEGLLEQSP
jgi:hypothetical protein